MRDTYQYIARRTQSGGSGGNKVKQGNVAAAAAAATIDGRLLGHPIRGAEFTGGAGNRVAAVLLYGTCCGSCTLALLRTRQ